MRQTFLLDVRSPKEFANSHIPTALNFPVLNDVQHKEIGILYKQNPLEAKQKGSAYICENISKFLSNQDIFHPKNKLFLYCARGGQRSKSLWLILREIGFDCERIQGGYKAFRQGVLERLSNKPHQKFLTLYGMTGCGKSEIIKKASQWSIDLENLSKHYGSSFGDQANDFLGQPSQAMFENLLDFDLKHKKEVLLVEGESKKMGKIIIPNAFFNAIHQGIKITLKASIQTRIKRIIKMYADIDEQHFLICIQKIRPYLQKNFFEDILSNWQQRNLECVASILLEKYYDRVYRQNPSDFIVDSENIEKAYAEIYYIAQSIQK